VSVRATSEALGKNPSQLQNKNAKISGIIRNGNFFFPDNDTQLEMGDELFVLGKEDSVNKIVDAVVEEG
jgi:Trk K+ transport system NAD-binding subunit